MPDKKVIKEIVQEELKNIGHKCRFGISDKEIKDAEIAIRTIASLGNGNVGKGIELMRDNHKWLYKQRQLSDKVSTAFVLIIVSTLLTGVITAMYAGIRSILGK